MKVLWTKFFGADGSSFGCLSSPDVHWGICLNYEIDRIVYAYPLSINMYFIHRELLFELGYIRADLKQPQKSGIWLKQSVFIDGEKESCYFDETEFSPSQIDSWSDHMKRNWIQFFIISDLHFFPHTATPTKIAVSRIAYLVSKKCRFNF